MVTLPRTRVPIVAAPMAGGPSTPALVAAVAEAGGFGFLAAGYKTADALAAEVAATRAMTDAPFGVNLFAPEPAHHLDLADFTDRLVAYASERGIEAAPGAVEWEDDDQYAAKLALLLADPVAVVSFTFGLPPATDVDRLQAVGTCVVATVTNRAEADAAAAIGCDALCVQGPEAGGHRGTHAMTDAPGATGLADLLDEIAPVGLPMVAAGGISTARDVARVLERGAAAAQLGTAFLLTPEAGTHDTYRAALGDPDRHTVLTRSFSGRLARGLANGWTDALEEYAPAAYPQVNQLTGPLRRAAAAAGDVEGLHLWAGTGYRTARSEPAADVVARLAPEAG